MFDWSNKISDDEIAFVVGESDKVIYVWIGQNTSIVKKYKGGTLATKIKSQYQFYGFRTQTINQGEETGALKEEIAKLLGGQGSALSEKEKSSHVPIATQVSTPAPAPRPVEHVLIAQREVEAPPEKKITPAYQLNDLEAELENERKKASHRVAKMKEEMDAQKAELDAEIKRLSDELESAKNAINDVKKNAEMECKQLRGEKVALQGMVDSLKKDVDGMKDKPQSDAGIQKKMEELQRELDNFKEIQTKHDELLSLSEGLEKNNKELKGTISELQSEITILKSRLEAASKGAGSGEEIKKLKEDLEKEKIASIDARVESKKKLESTVAEYENKLKALEDKAASYKEQLERTQRDSMKRDDVKTAPVPKPPNIFFFFSSSTTSAMMRSYSFS